MKFPLLLTFRAFAALTVLALAAHAAPAIKIGFLVKQPEEPWFQLEWTFAEQAAKEFGFTLVKIGAIDGEKTLSAIDNLAAGGAQGLIIFTPDNRLRPAILAKARAPIERMLEISSRD